MTEEAFRFCTIVSRVVGIAIAIAIVNVLAGIRYDLDTAKTREHERNLKQLEGKLYENRYNSLLPQVENMSKELKQLKAMRTLIENKIPEAKAERRAIESHMELFESGYGRE